MGFYTKFLYLLNFFIPLLILILLTTLAQIDDKQVPRLAKPPKGKLRSEMTEAEKKADDAAKNEALKKLTKTDAAVSFGSDKSNYKTVTLGNDGGFVPLPAPPTLPATIASPEQQPTTAMLMCPGGNNAQSADFSTGKFDDCLELQAKASTTILYDIDSTKTNNDPKYLTELGKFNGNIFADKNKVLKIDFAGADLKFYLVSLANNGRRRRSPRDNNAVVIRSWLSDAANEDQEKDNKAIIEQPGYEALTGGPIESVGVTLKVEKEVAGKMSAEQTEKMISESKAFTEGKAIKPIDADKVIDDTSDGSADGEEALL